MFQDLKHFATKEEVEDYLLLMQKSEEELKIVRTENIGIQGRIWGYAWMNQDVTDLCVWSQTFFL